MLSQATLARAAEVLDAMRASGLRIATAESCTGGLIAAALTHIAGSSDVVDRGFVTYSNQAKTDLLGVAPHILARHGAVSQEVAAAMVSGALERSGVAIAIAVTGVAGPGGGSPQKPVGLVWFGCLRRGRPVITQSRVFDGDREAVRAATVDHALSLMLAAAG